jgi:hypothetical protein
MYETCFARDVGSARSGPISVGAGARIRLTGECPSSRPARAKAVNGVRIGSTAILRAALRAPQSASCTLPAARPDAPSVPVLSGSGRHRRRLRCRARGSFRDGAELCVRGCRALAAAHKRACRRGGRPLSRVRSMSPGEPVRLNPVARPGCVEWAVCAGRSGRHARHGSRFACPRTVRSSSASLSRCSFPPQHQLPPPPPAAHIRIRRRSTSPPSRRAESPLP